MFFWKFTRSGKFSSRYISLILDFHSSSIKNNHLETNFDECKDILYLIHDVEKLNGINHFSAGLEKRAFEEQVAKLGYRATNSYNEQRFEQNLVLGQMTLGTHQGSPLDYGLSNKKGEAIYLNIENLKINMKVNASTGIVYGTEDKLKAYRNNKLFINSDFYFDLMPMHSCIVEIVKKMMEYNSEETLEFLKNDLNWKETK